jgi:hypothetical protein
VLFRHGLSRVGDAGCRVEGKTPYRQHGSNKFADLLLVFQEQDGRRVGFLAALASALWTLLSVPTFGNISSSPT